MTNVIGNCVLVVICAVTWVISFFAVRRVLLETGEKR